jgi:integrase
VRHLQEKKKLAPRTVRECYRICKNVLETAVNEKLIPENPCRGINLPKLTGDERRFLSAPEVDRLASSIESHYQTLIYSAAYLGLRWGELAGLRVENLDLLRGQVRVWGSLEEVSGSLRYVGWTKTEASRRTVTIPPFLVQMLARHLEGPQREFVFVGPNGGFLRRSNFGKRHLKPAALRAGLAPLRFHDLRHTCAAMLIDQDCNPLAIRKSRQR